MIAAPALLFSLVAHEFAHAEAAYRQGDDTAYMLRRITLDPRPHIDPFLTVVMPAMSMLLSQGTFIFGGAKPVPVNTRKFRDFRKGDLIVSSAGVATNFVLAFAFALLFVVLGQAGSVFPAAAGVLEGAQRMATWGIWLNLLLCFFNLIPVPPLDGSKILYHFLPPAWGAKYRELDRFGFILVLILVAVLPSAVLNTLLMPAFYIFFGLQQAIVPGFGLGEGWRIFG